MKSPRKSCLKNYSFLDTHNSQYKDQYGIRNRHSAAQAVTDFIIKARENNQHTLVTYLDMSKAFDTIDKKY